MAKSIEDDLRELTFPFGGLDLTRPTSQGRPENTEVGENVRFFESFTGRGRGGSRPGIDKFAADQVSGENEIQHLAAVVTVDGQMIDWSFDGPEQRFPGVYAGIGFIDFNPQPLVFPVIRDDGNPFSETFDNEATSGYTSKKPKNEKIVTIITPSAYSAVVGSSVVLTALLRNREGGFLTAPTLTDKNIHIHTDPPGRDGDGDFGSAGASQLTPTVTSAVGGLIYYRATVISVTGVTVSRSTRTKVRWTAATPTITWDDPAAIVVGTPLSATQLNATAGVVGVGNVPGTFTYTPPINTVLAEGNDQVLHVDFVPDDTESFNNASKDVEINVISEDYEPDDIDSAQCITNAASSSPPGTCTVEITLTGGGGTLEVTADVDPGTAVLPNTNPAWGSRDADSLIPSSGGAVEAPFSCQVRLVSSSWYYYIAPF